MTKNPRQHPRSYYNLLCADILSTSPWGRINPEAMDTIYHYIKSNPDYRIGQVICNYIFPEYQKISVGGATRDFFNQWFPGPGDPFFEEPEATYHRWNNRH